MAQIDLFHLLFPQGITSYGTMSSIATLLQFCFVCIHSQLNVANIEFPAWSSYTLLMLHGILFPDAWLLSCPFAHIWAQECLIHMFGEKRSTWSEREQWIPMDQRKVYALKLETLLSHAPHLMSGVWWWYSHNIHSTNWVSILDHHTALTHAPRM